MLHYIAKFVMERLQVCPLRKDRFSVTEDEVFRNGAVTLRYAGKHVA